MFTLPLSAVPWFHWPRPGPTLLNTFQSLHISLPISSSPLNLWLSSLSPLFRRAHKALYSLVSASLSIPQIFFFLCSPYSTWTNSRACFQLWATQRLSWLPFTWITANYSACLHSPPLREVFFETPAWVWPLRYVQITLCVCISSS